MCGNRSVPALNLRSSQLTCAPNYDTRPQRYEQRAEREKREAVAEAQTEAAKKFSRERLELFEKVRYSVIV